MEMGEDGRGGNEMDGVQNVEVRVGVQGRKAMGGVKAEVRVEQGDGEGRERMEAMESGRWKWRREADRWSGRRSVDLPDQAGSSANLQQSFGGGGGGSFEMLSRYDLRLSYGGEVQMASTVQSCAHTVRDALSYCMVHILPYCNVV